MLNAFAVPGGYVFVFTGLIARASTDDELAGVLGHEIGHVNAHHIVAPAVGGRDVDRRVAPRDAARCRQPRARGRSHGGSADRAAQVLARLRAGGRLPRARHDHQGRLRSARAHRLLQAAPDRAARESRRVCPPTCCRTPSPRIASPTSRAWSSRAASKRRRGDRWRARSSSRPRPWRWRSTVQPRRSSPATVVGQRRSRTTPSDSSSSVASTR